ncbi:DUF6185 family protein [Lentzea flaviverrucosa]|uniref:Uncharacterized protein n=1 Tax=Lentzea flaviverrucosa TaxID=200379 RepID=A0A1H9SM18_9PSEU|nr:DUF6185 family protein [Lentzea flaviverrucosa]RDI25429.1 hypothetical protein DFR72_108121 [Lentzea flaviverrucosa]SER85928.1 hypothetical protein SAMN05216195_107122 [Lentzea flaviverrucosa]
MAPSSRRKARAKSEPGQFGLTQKLLAGLTFQRREPEFLLLPSPLNRAVSVAWGRLRAWRPRWAWAALFVLLAGGASIGGVSWFATTPNPSIPQNLKCDNGTFRQAKVTARVQLDVAGLDYPRVTSDLEITVPRSTPGSEFLLTGPSSETGRAAFACLLGDSRSPLEVRQSPPKVVTRDGAVVVTQHSYADVLNTNVVWADLARIDVDTSGQPWLLTIDAPWGLRFAQWDVTLGAPEGWLSGPWPSNPVEVSTTQLRWPSSVPAASRDGKTGADMSHVVVSAKLKPDTKSAFAAVAADRWHKPFAWGAYWLSALVFALYIRWVLRIPRGQRRYESPAGRATRYLPLLVFMAGTQAVLDALPPMHPKFWPNFGWAANGALLAVTALAALHWRVPRIAVLLLYAAGLNALLFAFPRREIAGRWWADMAGVVLAFIITLLFVIWVGKALLTLLREQTSTPLWLWGVGSLCAAVLILERVGLAWVNNQRQQWLGLRQVDRAVTELYRYYPLDLLDETAWLALLVGAAAVWRHAMHSFQDSAKSPMPVAIALFAVGPMWWDVHLWGVWWWAWPLGGVALALFWLLTRLHRPPVPDNSAAGDRKPNPTHTLVAAGPGGSPTENMRTAVRFAAVPSLIAGTGLLITEWVVYPMLSINQQDSVVLDVLDTIAWELAKWLLAATALGLAWRHLPGNRWLSKTVPILLAYAVAPVGQYLVNRASNGVANWVPLVDVMLFTSVMLFVALRLDFASPPADRPQRALPGRVEKFLMYVGLSNMRGRWGEALTLVMALLAIWAAITGGEVAFPSVDPGQFSRQVPTEH